MDESQFRPPESRDGSQPTCRVQPSRLRLVLITALAINAIATVVVVVVCELIAGGWSFDFFYTNKAFANKEYQAFMVDVQQLCRSIEILLVATNVVSFSICCVAIAKMRRD
jgi:hypothetical protein